MKKIKCPNCGSEIQPSRGAYDNILKQVRDQEFQNEIEAYRDVMEQEKQAAINEAKLQAESDAKKIIVELTNNLNRMEAQSEKQIFSLKMCRAGNSSSRLKNNTKNDCLIKMHK